MIDRASDYDFITGITNGEVLINGQIMPWRDVNGTGGTTSPNCMRGEDVTFAREAVARMEYVGTFGWSQPSLTAYTPSLGYPWRVIGDRLHRYYGGVIAEYNYVLFPKVDLPDRRVAKQSMLYTTAQYAYQNELALPRDCVAYNQLESGMKSNNVRRVYHDLMLPKYVVPPKTPEQTTENTPVATATVQAGSASRPPGVPDSWPLPSLNYGLATRHICGESVGAYSSSADGSTYLKIAKSWHTSLQQWTLQFSADISRYTECDSVLVMFTTVDDNSSHNLYHATNYAQFYTIPATFSGDKVTISASDLLPKAEAYMVAEMGNQMFTQGRPLSDVAVTTYGWYGDAFHVEFDVAPIFKIPSIDFSDIGWNWTP